MTVLQLEKRILDYLTTNGAASKFEIQTAIGCSKAGVQSAVKSLLDKGSVEHAKSLRRHNSPRRHAVFSVVVAKPTAPVFKQPSVESVNVFEHPEIYSRLHALETQLNALAEATGNLGQRLDTQRDSFIEYIEATNVFQSNLGKRLRALERTQPAVDPLYTEIERDITDKLGGQISPELLRTTIDNAYAERKK